MMKDTAFIPAVLDDAALTLAEFRVYCHVIRRTNGGRVVSTAGIESMARVCRLRRQTVRDALRSLKRQGFIVDDARPGRTTVYRLTPAPIREGHPGTQAGGVEPDPGTHSSPTPAPIREGTPPVSVQTKVPSEGANGEGSNGLSVGLAPDGRPLFDDIEAFGDWAAEHADHPDIAAWWKWFHDDPSARPEARPS